MIILQDIQYKPYQFCLKEGEMVRYHTCSPNHNSVLFYVPSDHIKIMEIV